RYSLQDYESLIHKVKKLLPDSAIGVDVIVGFPGETEEDFIHTHNFLRELPISYLHVFTYSERPDTKAISLPGIVDVQERKRRNNILRILSEKKRSKFYSDMVGSRQSVLFENAHKNGLMQGFTSNYIKLQIDFNEELAGRIFPVNLLESTAEYCTGEVLSIKNSIDLVVT
ncbi:MAG TPA: tRNA (N(6)-L-threonylcarbamoyladenosine(37)-C(2))-methylthiotransferase MtaB, partial [Ignavibacteriaceae bacterium]